MLLVPRPSISLKVNVKDKETPRIRRVYFNFGFVGPPALAFVPACFTARVPPVTLAPNTRKSSRSDVE